MIALHLALKDLRLLARDPVALFWVFGFPVLFALFLGGVVRAGLRGETGPLELVVVDAAETPASRRLVDALERAEGLVVRSASLETAQRVVRRGEAVAYLEVPPGWGSPVRASEGGEAVVPLRLGIDPSREVEGALLRGAIARAVQGLGAEGAAAEERRVAASLGALGVGAAGSAGGRGGTEPPLVVERAAGLREAELVFPAAVLWGLIGCAASFAVSLVTERTRGTLLRLVTAPIDKSALLWGKALACLLACLAVAVALTFLAVGGFEVRFESLLGLLAAIGSAALCFVGITMLLSSLGRSEQAVAGAGWAVLILMAMLGGGMVPLSLMPSWLRSLSHLSPAKWSVLALEGATWRAFSPEELVLPCGVLLAVAGGSFFLGVRSLARMDP